MPTTKKVLGATAFALALAGGGVAGAVLGTPTVTNAQDGDTPATTEADRDVEGPRFGEHRGDRLAVAAEALGISEDDLRTALEDGQSIEQVAEAEGVDPQTVIDALVAEATANLEAAIDDLPDRMRELVAREGLPERPGGPRRGEHLGVNLEAAAGAIGISQSDLRSTLRGGSSIAEVATAHDVEVSVVIDAMVAASSARLDDAVAAGRLTEEEAAERKADLEERLTALANGERPAWSGGPGRGGEAPSGAPDDGDPAA